MAVGSGITRKGDLSSGHECWFPTMGISASVNVFVNKRGAHRQGDKLKGHICDKKYHMDTMAKGSLTVRVNKKSVMRIGDLNAPGGVMAQGSHTVLAGG